MGNCHERKEGYSPDNVKNINIKHPAKYGRREEDNDPILQINDIIQAGTNLPKAYYEAKSHVHGEEGIFAVSCQRDAAGTQNEKADKEFDATLHRI